MGDRSALPLAAALWLGILLAPRGGGPRTLLSIAFEVSAALALAWLARRAPPRTASVALTLALLLAGLARGGAHREALERARSRIDFARLARLEGTVVEPPNLAADQVAVVVKVRHAEGERLAGTRLRLRLAAGARVEWGDELECLVRLDPTGRPRDPGGFDPQVSANAAGLVATGRALSVTARPPRGVLRLARVTLARWRRGIEGRLERNLTPPALELTLPLVTGDRSAVPVPLDADLRSAGLIHLLALSGLHVVALAAAARALAASAGGGVGARAIVGILAALLYTGIAGPVPSLVRAAVSECWLGAARIARRAADPVQGLAITVMVLLGLAPGWAWDLGFQLSCAATLGLATLGAPIAATFGRARVLGAAIGPTVAAQLVSAPILIARVHGLSWPGIVANLVAVPIAGLLLAGAWLAVIADALAPGAGHFGFSACEVLARAMVVVTERAAAWPEALVPTGHEPGIALLATYGAILLVIAAAEPRDLASRGRARSGAGEAALFLGVWASGMALLLAFTAREPRPPAGHAWIVPLDVGQGDAIALGFADGWWLVDAGPRSPRHDAGESVVRPFLRWAPVRRLRRLALTHDDGDHTGGARAVLRAVRVDTLMGPRALPGVRGPLARFAAGSMRGSARARFEAALGDTLHRDPLVRVLWPPSRAASDTSDEVRVATRGDNAAGLVLAIEAGSVRALLLADVDSLVENSLTFTAPIALLKVGHHGSASSSGESFLARAAAPEGCLSVGAFNVYGHPAASALARLAAANVALTRTDRDGALWYELGPEGVRRLDWRSHDPCAIRAGDRAAAFPAGVIAPRLP